MRIEKNEIMSDYYLTDLIYLPAGKNNGLLCTPRLCPHEDLECILEGVKRVCQYRRDAFGEQGAPIAIGIRRPSYVP